MKVRIYRPAKSAMQSGNRNSQKWLLAPIDDCLERSINKLMGWIASSNTNTQLKLEFLRKEDAIAFAKKNNLTYELEEPNISTLKHKSYASNFTS